jgi:hypothetical protein
LHNKRLERLHLYSETMRAHGVDKEMRILV